MSGYIHMYFENLPREMYAWLKNGIHSNKYFVYELD